MTDESSRKSKRWGAIGVVAVAVAFLAVAGFNFWRLHSREESREEALVRVPVSVIEARMGDVERWLETTGDLRPLQDVFLYPTVSGKKVVEITAERGERVRAGQVLVRLDDAEIRARLDQARAAVEAAATQVGLLERDRARFEALYKEKAVARQRLDRIRSEHEAALARLKEARSALEALQVLHGDFTLKAPMDGLLADRYLDPGNMTDTKKPVVRITTEDRLKVVFQVSEPDFPLIREGMTAECRVAAYPARVFRGRVQVLTPVLDPVTRTAQAELHVPNPDLALRSGMFAHVRLFLGSRRALVIERDAVLRVPGTGTPYVFVVRDGKAVLRNVRLGAERETLVEVVEGLQEGDRVVVRGQNRLSEGVPVEVVQGEGS
ncbi:Barrel-sandwich domain of CusB or HlyD membrane-fusion [Desulfacinum infernum DSM 9756]|uniref:Barrel-sandwich domain of CusB or HlyD membrane-fusion n=1 Tax=Desulfacinum infernum DSM 9756 TaxID=1121391 RepID=A0A1M5G569_9BACT|nr:efflux RND transporter periplasmic adaptor subunit [Desulfacinum infernum]SHF98970.1 Barrel-sandwich domain of CusB or HlyD membrane-fusion [Desulfacinum infernum DSM 9756]